MPALRQAQAELCRRQVSQASEQEKASIVPALPFNMVADTNDRQQIRGIGPRSPKHQTGRRPQDPVHHAAASPPGHPHATAPTCQPTERAEPHLHHRVLLGRHDTVIHHTLLHRTSCPESNTRRCLRSRPGPQWSDDNPVVRSQFSAPGVEIASLCEPGHRLLL